MKAEKLTDKHDKMEAKEQEATRGNMSCEAPHTRISLHLILGAGVFWGFSISPGGDGGDEEP